MLTFHQPVILASASPRRKELLSGLGIHFQVLPSNVEEVYADSLPLREVPVFLADLKASFLADSYPDCIIIAADTVVLVDNEVLGKPVKKEEAVAILQKLSGRRHEVITGVCIVANGHKQVFSDTTEVFFQSLSEEEIRFYIDEYKPYDKAGAYGVQEWIGYVAVEKIHGSFYNVMGLPVNKVYAALKEISNSH